MDKKVERVVLSGSSQLPLVLDGRLPDVQLAVEMAPSYCAFFCCCSSLQLCLSPRNSVSYHVHNQSFHIHLTLIFIRHIRLLQHHG